jgi:hypothetical protein
MSKEKLLELVDLYEAELLDLGAVARRIDEGVLVVPGVSHNVLRDHLLWCCEHVKELAAGRGEVSAAQQWVKFIQGALWAMGDFSISDMRGHTARAATSRQPGARREASP